MPKKTASQALSVATFAAMLYCVWLLIQFFRGQAAFWPITALNTVLPDDHRLTGSLAVALGTNGPGFVGFIFYYIAGLFGYTLRYV